MKLLTQAEAAERLSCTNSKVARLRKAGAIPYFPGRPVLIDEADIDAYVKRVEIAAQQSAEAKQPRNRESDPIGDAGIRARRVWLARRLSGRG